MVRLVIVAGIRLYREGLANVLAETGRVEVVGAFATADEAIARMAHDAPEIVLLDMAGGDALAAVPGVLAAVPGIKVVALGVADTSDVLACAEVGAAAYVLRESSVDELVATITGAAREELRCSPRVAAALMGRVARLAAQTGSGSDSALTAREREIMALIDEGLSNKQIAKRLCIEVATVKNHVHHILDKLGARTRGEAAAKVRYGRRRYGSDRAILTP